MKNLKCKRGKSYYAFTAIIVVFDLIAVVMLVMMLNATNKLWGDAGDINFIDKLFYDVEILKNPYLDWSDFWRDEVEKLMIYTLLLLVGYLAFVIPASRWNSTVVFKNDNVFLKVPFGKKKLNPQEIVSVTQNSENSFVIKTTKKDIKIRNVKNSAEICDALQKWMFKEK